MSPAGSRRAAALALAAIWMLAAPALAERGDRDKPLNIESDSMMADEAKKTATFEGKVVMSQGSLVIRADRIVVRQDNDGFQYGIATGSPATFRHKQDGNAGYIDGQAQRIEYDGKAERVELFDDARLRRDSGDDIRGDFISYDARSERFTVKSGGEASGPNREGRVRATIMPKKPATGAASGPDAGQRN
ncbi:MAG TPA: lipopolysaccharide transport periplasmic protein LptA [Burkholderiales bacterium]|nr:lipopolysaccharide transport periplasmic protein LptA [Burkholderiales bacterium]HYA46261.1 lipopolysaccharide transport periplasmic protein LptA [Burkholderiales bacterium]